MKYCVKLFQTTTTFIEVYVEAKDEEAAHALAERNSIKGLYNWDDAETHWEGGVDDCEELG